METITAQNAVAFTRHFGDRVETMAELAREGYTGHMHLDDKGDAVAFIWGAAAKSAPVITPLAKAGEPTTIIVENERCSPPGHSQRRRFRPQCLRENAVILGAFQAGVISSATAMANMTAIEAACVMARHPILEGRNGLHFNLTYEGAP